MLENTGDGGVGGKGWWVGEHFGDFSSLCQRRYMDPYRKLTVFPSMVPHSPVGLMRCGGLPANIYISKINHQQA